ncbi:lytic polysaccharide monooxygenase [Actinomycetes bacterium KLBMP 9797]
MKVSCALAVVAIAVLATPAPAAAHGALTNPVSRLAACGTEGAAAGSAACVAALRASGTDRFADWDNLRIAGVAGRDRETIPDGKLCSGGIERYRGLDLPRADWPVTRLAPGATFAFSYRTTIPHLGEFRLYVTRDGYTPTKPLTWAALEAQPFLSVTDPAVRDGAYRFTGDLPAGKSGRHLIYTIWQNAGPDTYYSCSDVLFDAPRTSPAAAAKAATAPPVSPSAVPTSPPAAAVPAAPRAATVSTTSALPLVGAGAAVILLLGALYAVLLHHRRTRRPPDPPDAP